jgi:hypothetical protein
MVSLGARTSRLEEGDLYVSRRWFGWTSAAEARVSDRAFGLPARKSCWVSDPKHNGWDRNHRSRPHGLRCLWKEEKPCGR